MGVEVLIETIIECAKRVRSQLVNYLTATGIDDGILINFGSEKIEIRHRTRLYKRKM